MINYQLWDLLGPVTWPLWLAMAAAVLFIRRGNSRRGRELLFASVALGILFGVLPTGSWLIAPLEQRFPASRLTRPPGSVVVLGGAERLAASEWRGALELNASGERVLEGAALAHRFPAAPLAIAGGIRLKGSTLSDVGLVVDAWERLGVPRARIVRIDHTPDTCANARGAAAARLPQPILLVTSAAHMPRAVACFRAAGLAPLVYPVDYQAIRPGRASGGLLSNLGALDFAAHEWIGLAWYPPARPDGGAVP